MSSTDIVKTRNKNKLIASMQANLLPNYKIYRELTYIDHPENGDWYINGQTVSIDAHQRQEARRVAGLQ